MHCKQNKIIMNKESFKELVENAVLSYLDNEEGYGDSAQLQIDPTEFTVEIVDADADLEDKDYYMVMDLVKGSDLNIGSFEPDADAIQEVVDEYFKD